MSPDINLGNTVTCILNLHCNISKAFRSNLLVMRFDISDNDGPREIYVKE